MEIDAPDADDYYKSEIRLKLSETDTGFSELCWTFINTHTENVNRKV